MQYQLITPEKIISKGTARSITVPTREQGYITILEHHRALIGTLGVGELVIHTDEGETLMATDGGFLEIKADGEVIMLTDYAIHAHELDESAIIAAQERAALLLKEGKFTEDVSYTALAGALERELAKLRVARKHKRL